MIIDSYGWQETSRLHGVIGNLALLVTRTLATHAVTAMEINMRWLVINLVSHVRIRVVFVSRETLGDTRSYMVVTLITNSSGVVNNNWNLIVDLRPCRV